jgi:hypothetical protein
MKTQTALVVLFFLVVTTAGAAEPASEEFAARQRLQAALEALGAENAELQARLNQQEQTIRTLTENLAIARTESELFQKKWAEARLRAQTLGVDFADAGLGEAQRQLVESLRALYLAEAERQRLVQQLQRLLAALQTGEELAREVELTRELLAAVGAPLATAADRLSEADRPAEPSLAAAQVLEVNPKLRLAVLNVGWLHGARVGMPMLVMRGERVVAELRIVEVRRRISGAVIERIDGDIRLSDGDSVRVTQG